jgi:hypothetical protein
MSLEQDIEEASNLAASGQVLESVGDHRNAKVGNLSLCLTP